MRLVTHNFIAIFPIDKKYIYTHFTKGASFGTLFATYYVAKNPPNAADFGKTSYIFTLSQR